jgi:hypothetical protein
MAQVAPFYAEMTHFTLPLHALREELIALAGATRTAFGGGS